ncbi:MAG: carboxypeptidase-like regulatory domain-containing protein, partial [Tannerella sp.]|nr:carboxypeptidase-like regulatory domain-containing protein [Tannerella sp.]
VFIANTTIAMLTDRDGKYRISIPGAGNFQLAVSHVSYQPVFKDIEHGNISVEMNIAMNDNELDEVVITQKVKARRTDINLFWRTILGKSPSKKSIFPVNPDDVFYFYNRETNMLKVSCRIPIQIINNELGYHITIVLDFFTHDYGQGISSWNYRYMFNELEPEDQKQKNIWDENRKKVYKVSFTNFIKSMYNNKLLENGFVLAYLDKKIVSGNYSDSLSASRHFSIMHPMILSPTSSDSLQFRGVDLETFLSIDSKSGGKTFFVPPDQKEFLVLICFGNPVSQKNMENVDLALKGKRSWSRTGLVRSVLETPDIPVPVFPDGTFGNPLKITPLASMSLTGLNLKLPLDYEPEIDSNIP